MMRIRDWVQIEIGGFLLSLVLRILYASMRWQTHPLFRSDAPLITGPRVFAFWHNRQVMMPCLCHKAIRAGKMRPAATLISAHRDGRLIARAISYLGLESVVGSSTRGGTEALIRLIRILQAGKDLAITPDGPRGPIYKVKLGVLKAAQKGAAPIYPCAYAASSYWRLKSWDQMIVPKPFSRGVALIGEPLVVPAHCNDQEMQKIAERLERRLMAVTESADQALGLIKT